MPTRRLQEHLTAAGLADNTIYQYVCMFDRWQRWADGNGHAARWPTAIAVRAWSATLPTGVSTRDSAKAAIKHWCEAAGLQDVSDAVERPEKNSRKVGRQLSRDEARRLLEAADAAGERGYAIYLGLFTGMRISELCRTRWEKHDLETETLTFYRPKNDMWHTIPLHPLLATWAAPYVETGGGWCFPGHNQGHLGEGALRNSIRKMVEAAGLPTSGPDKVTPHALRRTAARQIYEAAAFDLTIPQQLLGHKRVTTTGIYLGATVDATRPALRLIDYRTG